MKRRRLSGKFFTVLLFPVVILVLMMTNFFANQNHYAHSQDTTFNQIPTALGIDVSEHQKEIDWESMDTTQVNFVIVRTGYGYEEDGAIDHYFYDNIKNAKKLGLKVGVYHYSYAMSVEEAKKEAQFVLSILDGMDIDLPIYFDFEDPIHDTLTNAQMDEITKAFLSEIKEGGYATGIYANTARLNCLSPSYLSDHAIWIASYGSEPLYSGTVQLWQYTNQGRIDGISTYVDLNYGYY